MQCLTSGFFQLVLWVLPKLASDIIIKGLKVSEIFLKKDFNIRPHDKSGVLVAVLMLCPFGIDSIIKIRSGKWDIISSSSFWYFEIIFILFIKKIVVYVKCFQIIF